MTEWLIILAGAIAAVWWWLAHRRPLPSQLEPMSRLWLSQKSNHRTES